MGFVMRPDFGSVSCVIFVCMHGLTSHVCIMLFGWILLMQIRVQGRSTQYYTYIHIHTHTYIYIHIRICMYHAIWVDLIDADRV